MSMTDIIGRIGTIESMIEQLSTPIRAQKSSAVPAAAANAAAFETALAAAAGGTSAGSSLAADGLTALTGAGTLSGVAGLGAGIPASPVQAGSATGTDVAATAKKYIGVPYVWGGTNPATGMDCSGFVQRVFKDLGVELPRVVSDQMKVGTPVASLAEAKPGDLLVSFGGEHISIYLGNGKAIDAPVPGQTIQIRDAWEQQSNLTAIRRIVPAAGAS
ncbi:NLP/P60 protein [Pseudarthrobacter chlorophenolicus A6]|uniref:NLP/P60 protein n=1 Tax=Pseudarthrobacter chlorophenolicus (strain ATCC 700700 / DSM 12829 / CIP 107037 / JCM 12360 / KCTC 9906 / NCIMB 13794 / A6) TaxID=452863 RepID=B8HEK2_PSECP|nr:C40 family peptidase [Pseudarthrobacter chlorophenolicus]ACL40947.1 NLP/P60 protein [Pseudarthrobacter chlorophenolicus A6]SDQ72409.1 Cell wall-associated hydrolase, NlpC family [Pseudarthrobacter chlorophenolicus]